MLQIDIKSLGIGLAEFDLVPTAEEVDLDPQVFSSISVHARIEFDSREAIVMLTCYSIAALQCDRTLENYEQPVKGSFTVVFTPPERISANDGENAQDVRPLRATDETIDITAFVRDTLLLAIPIRKIAPGALDKEVPTRFGSPEKSDVDPRWEALKALSSDSEAASS
jgi:DUF177 domain-containing protein